MAKKKKRSTSISKVGGAGGQLIGVQPAVEASRTFISKSTVRAYARDWMDFFEVDSLEKVTVPMAVNTTTDQVADFRDRLIEQGMKPVTVSRKLSSVRSFFDQMILRGVMLINPAHSKLVRAPKRGDVRKMEALSSGEVILFLKAIDRTTPRGRRDYAVIMFDLHMGLRRSDALNVRTDQFRTMDNKACVIFRSKGEKERIVWVNKDLEKALSVYAQDRGTDTGWLFPGRDPAKHLSGDQFWRIVRKYLKVAGITKRVGTHGLRATFITMNLERGTPLDQIQKTVGHSRGETTLGYARDMEMVKSRAPAVMEGLNAD